MSKNHKHRADEPQQVTPREAEILVELARRSLARAGDLVELGCYRGDTSLLLERLVEEWNKSGGGRQLVGNWDKPGDSEQLTEDRNELDRESKRLYIYDSFAGLPAKSAEDASAAGAQFKEGELLVAKREVVERFKRAGLRVPVVKKAFFEELDPETDLPAQICFGFLDGDLYQSIKTSLKLCAPRVVPGGILVVHDYNNPELPGVARAVEEFLASVATKSLLQLRVQETLAILQF